MTPRDGYTREWVECLRAEFEREGGGVTFASLMPAQALQTEAKPRLRVEMTTQHNLEPDSFIPLVTTAVDDGNLGCEVECFTAWSRA